MANKISGVSTTINKGIAPYNLNAVNNAVTKMGLKPLTADQFQGMTPKQIDLYIKTGAKVTRINRKNFRRASRIARANARVPASENLKQAQLMHGTIRQGLAEIGAIGAQAIAGAQGQAIAQNTAGGTKVIDVNSSDSDSSSSDSTSQGPVYAHRSRED